MLSILTGARIMLCITTLPTALLSRLTLIITYSLLTLLSITISPKLL
jgi:hypothetical protein